MADETAKVDTTPGAVLDCLMGGNDADAETVREYLVALLLAVWSEGEGFSGKRPFGNSGWTWELHDALFQARMVGKDDVSASDALITDAIKALR